MYDVIKINYVILDDLATFNLLRHISKVLWLARYFLTFNDKPVFVNLDKMEAENHFSFYKNFPNKNQ